MGGPGIRGAGKKSYAASRLTAGGGGGGGGAVLPPGVKTITDFYEVEAISVVRYNAYNTSLGQVRYPEARATLKHARVSEDGIRDSKLLRTIYTDVATGLLLHVLAIAFPPIAILMAGIAVATAVAVSLEVTKAVDHYEHGTLKASEAGKVVKDVTNLAVGTATGVAVNALAPTPSSMTVSYSGSQVITEVAKEVVTDVVTDTASEEAGRIAKRTVRADRRRGLVRRRRRIQSRLDISSSQIGIVEASQA